VDGVELGLDELEELAEEDVLAVFAPGSGVNGLREEPLCWWEAPSVVSATGWCVPVVAGVTEMFPVLVDACGEGELAAGGVAVEEPPPPSAA
jgi:hypothetical protein